MAEQQQDYDRAVVEYTQALKEHPADKEARLALDRARVRASQQHFQRGRRLEAVGRYEEALLELQVAAELNPSNGDVEDLLRSTRLALRNKIAVSREGKTKLETLMEHGRESGPIGLELPKDIKLPSSLVFRDASSRDVLTALARFANVNITFDPAFRETPITIEVRNTTFEDALSSVTATTRTFFRVTAPRTVTIVPDTPAKRREYRGGDRPDVLSEQRGAEGDDRSPAHRRRRAPRSGHARHERDLDKGFARTHRRGRTRHYSD